MDEYISRTEAEEAIEEYCCRMCEDYSEVEGGCISHVQHCKHLTGEEILKPVKSADIQPAKHGTWHKDEQGYDDYVECSECGLNLNTSNYIENEWREILKYCPNCGARMDLGEENNEI